MVPANGADCEAVGDAGNKVAEVPWAGERGHGVAIGFVGAQEDEDRTMTGVGIRSECAVPGLAAASDGGTLKFRGEDEILFGQIFGWRLLGHDFSHVRIWIVIPLCARWGN